MNGAEVATIRLEEHACASRLDVKHGGGALGRWSARREQAFARPAEVHAQPLVHRFLDRDGPASGAAGALVPAEIIGVQVQAERVARVHGCSNLRIQITEKEPGSLTNLVNGQQMAAIGPAPVLLS